MSEIVVKRILSNDPESVRKRTNRKQLKEKRRQEAFIKSYVETKYSNVYEEAMKVYNVFKEQYPHRYDITKTYYYRKWEKEAKKTIASSYTVPAYTVLPPLPALPTFSVPMALPTTSTSVVPPALPPIPPPAISSPPVVSFPATVTESVLKTTEKRYTLYLPHLPILTNMNDLSEVTVETIQEGDQTQTGNVQQIMNEALETIEQTEQFIAELNQNQEEVVQSQQPAEFAHDQPREETQNNDIFAGMSLNDMNIAAEEIVRAIQSDRELLDIVENFDFPDQLWNSDYPVPDYVLENDMEW